MNKILKISLSLLIFPIITFCSEKSEKKDAFFSRGKGFVTLSYAEKNSFVKKNNPEESKSSPKKIENQNSELSKALSSATTPSTETTTDAFNPTQLTETTIDTSKPAQSTVITTNTSKPTQSNQPILKLGVTYDLPATTQQNVTFYPGILPGYDGKGTRESAASFIHRLIKAGKLLDACSKPDKLQSKEPKINERITEALREINLKFNDEQKKAHASVSKLLTEQKSNFTQNTNSMLSILLTLNSINISQVISGQDVELYNKNIQEEIDSLNKESKMFDEEKKAQVKHLEEIKEKLKKHLEVNSEKKESK